ncbi:uncharacterized protein MELLADRAFT_111204 [Melampsora larici-populina 98AG31]|uniref:Uncharacterized protein n=1 Tax=Melampsora larici-populina (strain 98AG31 / pathotype 3-4-7) TaxID=747676 RepID=F4S2D4_MELLP|nr:uncharacterized protein MELLADRAFT_111204 [Melampsora larici-populina 98AG31]EGG01155.1 hypothetical protein MELLADRAFT_111204 [Melampsora larici-populina 98AG31]
MLRLRGNASKASPWPVGKRIWIPEGKAAAKTVLVMKQCNKGRLVPFYGMREIRKTDHEFARGVKYSGETHRRIAEVTVAPVTPELWNEGITEGVKVWKEATRKKQKPSNESHDPILS